MSDPSGPDRPDDLSPDVSLEQGSELHPDDVELIERLRRIVEVVDPVPVDLVESGRALFRLHRPGVDLMTMLTAPGAGGDAVRDADGLVGAGLAAVRGPATSHLHFFELGTVTLDVEVTVRAGFADVVGAVTDASGAVASVTLETPAATFTTEPDADGRFEVSRVPVALMRLTLARGQERPVATPWFDPA